MVESLLCRKVDLMSALLLTFIIAVVNLGLGYALAVRMGFGPAGMWEAWDALLLDSGEPSTEGLPNEPAQDKRLVAPADPVSAQGFLETSVIALREALLSTQEGLVRIGAPLRSEQALDVQSVASQWQALRQVAEAFLTQLGDASDRFRVRLGDLGPLRPLGERIDMALVEQSTQLNATLRNLGEIDLSADPAVAAGRLNDEVFTLLSTLNTLREHLETACLAIVGAGNRWESLDDRICTDPSMNVPNRIGLERIVRQWREQGRLRAKPHCMVLLEMEDFGDAKVTHKAAADSQVLCDVAERIAPCLGPDDLIARYTGQKIVLLLSDQDASAASLTAQRVAQAIKRPGFASEGGTIGVQVRATVVPIKPEDPPQVIFERLEEAVGQTGQQGTENGLAFVVGVDPQVAPPGLDVRADTAAAPMGG